MKIIIDGDACPVKEEIFELSAQHSICVTLVSNFSHFSQKELPTHVTQIYVDSGPDSADYRIVAIAKEGDIIITQDYGLASLLLQKNCRVVHHNGTEYSQSTINQLLSIREVNAKLRQKGVRTKGPKPYTNEMRQEFRDKLNQLLN